jgi:ribosomal protein L12E/L44/L45/RPP1/RPP2
LDSLRFNALEHLLNTSELYTKFLSEQLKDVEARTDAEATTTAAAAPAAPKSAAKPGAKRTRKGAAKIVEEAKQELTPTQVFVQGLLQSLDRYCDV